MHEHNECEHELKYCKVCDTAYCEICKREWKKPATWQTWYNGTIGDGTITVPLVDNSHFHVT